MFSVHVQVQKGYVYIVYCVIVPVWREGGRDARLWGLVWMGITRVPLFSTPHCAADRFRIHKPGVCVAVEERTRVS